MAYTTEAFMNSLADTDIPFFYSCFYYSFSLDSERCNELQIVFIEKFDYTPCHIRHSRFLGRTIHQLHSELVDKGVVIFIVKGIM